MAYKYKKHKVFCILDTETTDVFWNSAAPIQIAAIIVDSEGNILSKFNERIKTNHRIVPSASEVHGIYAKDLEGCRSEKEVLTDFVAWMVGCGVDSILTYNGEVFDRPMLNMRCQVLGLPIIHFDKNKFSGEDARVDVFEAKKRNLYDLKSLGRKWRLTLVSEKLGISTEGAHDAWEDVRMLKEVFWKLDPLINPQDWEGTTTSLF